MYKILIALAVLLVLACQPAELPQDVDITPPEKTAPTDNGVVRQFATDSVAPGGEVKVKLYVNLNTDQTYYLYEEIPAEGFTVIDAETDSQGKVKGIEIQNAESTVFEYTVKAPAEPGTYTFGGEYAVEGMESPEPILGDNTINVQ